VENHQLILEVARVGEPAGAAVGCGGPAQVEHLIRQELEATRETLLSILQAVDASSEPCP
jgi:hypothetical protein